MITIKELARMCEVSSSTVSNILSGHPKASPETIRKVLETAKLTGYHPNYYARGMRIQKTKTIGVITEDLIEFSTMPIVEAVMGYCEENGYRIVLVNMRLYDKWHSTWYNDEEKYQSTLQPTLQELLSYKVDGIIYVAGHCRVINCIPDGFPIPAIVVYGISKLENITSVIINDKKSGFDMTSYLISMGHKKIGVIGGAAENLHTRERLNGYHMALFQNQILFSPAWLQYGNWKRTSGYEAAEKLLDEDVTAIFCMNDNMAAGAYDYFREQNIQVGKDISIVGCDNKEISEYICPNLTTIDLQFREIGYKAASLMLNLLDGSGEKAESRIVRVESRIIIRASVKNI